MRPISGCDPGHMLVRECEFSTIADVHAALSTLAGDPEHTRLLALKSPMMLDAYTEIYELLDF